MLDDLKSQHGVTDINSEEPGGESVEGKFCIRISEHKDEGYIDSLKHELAHVANYKEIGNKSLKGSNRHGENWKKWARILGCSPIACKKGKPSNNGPYMIGCPRGCFETNRHQYSKGVRLPENFQCKECGNPLASWNRGEDRPERYGCYADKK